MELKMIIKFEDREIVLTETEAMTLYNKLSEMFGKANTYPIYPVYPAQPINPTYTTPWCEITCVSTETVNVPFMREVKPFTKEEMVDIRKELDTSATTYDIRNETQWVNPNSIKLDGDTIDLSYYDALMRSLK